MHQNGADLAVARGGKEAGGFDAMVVFGYGPVLPGHLPGSGRLNLYGRINALAAGMLYRTHEIKTIIMSGARTGGQKLPSEASLMAQVVQSRFGVPSSTFCLEEQATNTILNCVLVANIIDENPSAFDRLLFVGLGFHLPRIREICFLVGLAGEFAAADDIVSARSSRHRELLARLLNPCNAGFAAILAEQDRWLRALRTTPDYWLPQMAEIQHPARLRRALTAERLQPFLRRQTQIHPASASIGDVRAWLRAMPRRLP